MTHPADVGEDTGTRGCGWPGAAYRQGRDPRPAQQRSRPHRGVLRPRRFADAERHDDYLLLHNDGVEIHFASHDTVTPGTCFVHVTDAMKMWKQLRD